MKVVDLETRCEANLPEVGGPAYAEHPSLGIICAVCADTEAKVVTVALPGAILDAPPALQWPGLSRAELVLPGLAGIVAPLLEYRVEIGHGLHLPDGQEVWAWNADGFERPVWEAQWATRPVWRDLLHIARRAMPHLPQYSLDAVAQTLLGVGKSPAGAELIRAYSVPGPDGTLRPLIPAARIAFAQYCLRDVALELLLAQRLMEMDQDAPEWERLVERVHQRINHRGIGVDLELAEALQRTAEHATRVQQRAWAHYTGLPAEAAQSTQQTLGWLRSQGYHLPNLETPTIEAVCAHPDTTVSVKGALASRQELARKSHTKLARLRAQTTQDGRLKSTLVYYGAHTGRWTGRRVQLQNLARPVDMKRLGSLESLIARTRAGDPALLRDLVHAGFRPADLTRTLLRPCFRAKPGHLFVIADYSQIEARAALWLAGDDNGLVAFTSGDPYLAMAARLFSMDYSSMSAETHVQERRVGKEVVLACGYQMGPKTFHRRAAMTGVDLAAAGVTAEQCVAAWRDAYPALAGSRQDSGFRRGGLWAALRDAAGAVHRKEGSREVARCLFSRRGDALVVELPSGRRLTYPALREVLRPPPWDVTAEPRPALLYGPGEGRSLYGGKLLENIDQAACRDLMAAALVRLDAQGVNVVLHIHDEIVVEVSEADAEAAKIAVEAAMSEGPVWSRGLPIGVKGHVSPFLTK